MGAPLGRTVAARTLLLADSSSERMEGGAKNAVCDLTFLSRNQYSSSASVQYTHIEESTPDVVMSKSEDLQPWIIAQGAPSIIVGIILQYSNKLVDAVDHSRLDIPPSCKGIYIH